MRIESVRLKSYKRFHDLEIRLGSNPSKFVALVGSNGCGKSSVLDGLLFLQSRYQNIGDTSQMDDSYHSLHNSIPINNDNVEIILSTGTFNQVWKEKNKVGKQQTIFSFRSPYRYNSNVKISEIRAVNEISKNNYGASTTVALDGKVEENYRRLLAKFNEYIEKKDVAPSKGREYIIGKLNSALKNCLDLKISSIGNVESDRGTLYFQKSDQTNEFDYNVLSSGEKEVVDILLDLYLRKDDYKDTVFLIDEPELHINTAIQRKLLREIDKLIGPKCQVWIATHSVGFLRALQDDIDDCQIIYFEPDAKFSTSRYVLRPVPKTREQWKKIFQTALEDLTGLVAPRRLVYCEGKAESPDGKERGVDATVYNNIFQEVESDTLFVSSGGESQSEKRSEIALAILKKAFVDVEILVLLDQDIKSGQETTTEHRQEFLRGSNNRRMLKRREIENYLYDKEVLRKYAETNGWNFQEQEFEKAVKDIGKDDVKGMTGKIKSLCGETRSINPKKFKVELSKVITQDMDIFKELHSCIFCTKCK